MCCETQCLFHPIVDINELVQIFTREFSQKFLRILRAGGQNSLNFVFDLVPVLMFQNERKRSEEKEHVCMCVKDEKQKDERAMSLDRYHEE